MRNTNDLIKLLLYLYNHTIWDDMEEYFAASEGLLIYHGAKWIDLEEVRGQCRREIVNSVTDDPNSRYYGMDVSPFFNSKFSKHIEGLFDNSEELNRLDNYLGSEEGFREELNMCKGDQEAVFHKFITFKND